MKSQRLKNLLLWSVRIVLALVVLLALFILEENVRGRILLARYKAELRAKGEKLTLAELNLPKPPKENNGAAALLAAADALGAATNANPLSQYRLAWRQFAAAGRAVVLCRGEQLGYWWSPTHSWDELSEEVLCAVNEFFVGVVRMDGSPSGGLQLQDP
jgi:hypothetical protein